MANVMSHLNQLNRKPQGKGNIVYSIFEEEKIFENKLFIFSQVLERETFFHFPSL